MIDVSNLGIDLNSILFYLVNYGLVFAIVYYFFGKTIYTFLQNRQSSIENNIKESELIKKDMKELNEKYEKERELALKNLEQRLKDSDMAIRKKSEEIDNYLEQKKKDLLKKAEEEMKDLKYRALNEVKVDVRDFMTKVILDYLKEHADKKDVETSVTKSFDQFIKKYE